MYIALVQKYLSFDLNRSPLGTIVLKGLRIMCVYVCVSVCALRYAMYYIIHSPLPWDLVLHHFSFMIYH